MILKNTASQKLAVRAIDQFGEAVTGDELQITCKVSIDHGTRNALTDGNPTETEDGVYLFDLTQAETDGDYLLFYPESSTAGVYVDVYDNANGTTQVRPNTVTPLDAAAMRAALGLASANVDDQFSAVAAVANAALTQAGLASTALASGGDVYDNVALLVSRLGIPLDLGSGTQTLAAMLRDLAGETYDRATDSNEAIRDRGDVGWTGGGGTTVDASNVNPKRTWSITADGEGHRAPQIVTVQDGIDVTYQFDFTHNIEATITGTPTVVITGPESVTAENVRLRAADQKAVLFDTPAISTLGTYTVKVTVSTTDSQTIPVEGTLVVQ